MQRRKMLFTCKAHNSEFVCRQKLVVSTHKLQKNVPENADKPANCKITLKPRPRQRRKMLFLCKAHDSEFSCRQKNSHALIAEKTCLTAKQVRCRRLFDRLAVQLQTRLKHAYKPPVHFVAQRKFALISVPSTSDAHFLASVLHGNTLFVYSLSPFSASVVSASPF